MISKFFSFFSTLMLLCSSGSLESAQEGQPAGIRWYTNAAQAEQIARQENKPLVLFFTGSDWCGWCIKLENEVLHTAQFAQATKGLFVFAKLDFPRNGPLDPALKEQNNQLKEQYQIRGFPSLLVISPQGAVLGKTGYKAGGPNNYANHLKELAGLR